MSCPRHIRCYDNGGRTVDRYTVVFTGRYTHKTDGKRWTLFMSEQPTHPQGIGICSPSRHVLDALPGSIPRIGERHTCLGKRIRFTDLPEACQSLVINRYRTLWGIGDYHACV